MYKFTNRVLAVFVLALFAVSIFTNGSFRALAQVEEVSPETSVVVVEETPVAEEETQVSEPEEPAPTDLPVQTEEPAPAEEGGEVLSATAEEPATPTEETAVTEEATESVQEEITPTQPLVLSNPTLSTDKEDYHLYETVNILGNFFQSLQSIVLKIFGTDPEGGNYTESTQDVVTNENGSFLSSYQIDLIYRPLYTITASSLLGEELARITFTDAPPSIDLEQCRNGAVGSPNPCDDAGGAAGWVTGNVGASQGHYLEGHSIPYRAVFKNLPVGPSITLTLGYDIKHSSAHAIDYLTHYNRLEPHTQFSHSAETIDPTDGVSGIVGTPTTFLVPAPSSAGSPVTGEPATSFGVLPAGERAMTLYGGTITGIAYATEGNLTDAQAETRITVTFTAASSNAVLAWGGHIATADVWGAGNSAGGISGSPYHMRLISWSLGNIGNTDRSLSAAVVAAPQQATLTLQKTVINDNGGGAVDTAWTLSASGPTPISGIEGNVAVTSAIVDPGTYNISESGPSGYSASSWVCVGVTQDDGDTLTLAAGDNATCTITNDDVAPKLTLVKTVVNDNGGNKGVSDFPLFISGTPATSGTAYDQTANVQLTSTETTQTGYAPSVWGGDCADDGTITLNPGDDKTCTITNDDIAPKLIVIKHVINNDGDIAQASDFIMQVTGTDVSNPSFSGAEAPGTTVTLDAGSYSVDELTSAGYDKTLSADCSGSIAVGETKTCTITNDDKPHATRTQGFWQTHTIYTSGVFNLGPWTIGTHVIDTNSELFAGFYSSISKTSTGAKRSAIDQARMQMLQQWLAAKLNCQAFGCTLGTQALLTNAATAWAGGNISLIKSYASQLDTYNNSNDALPISGQGKATPKNSQSSANSSISFWNVLP